MKSKLRAMLLLFVLAGVGFAKQDAVSDDALTDQIAIRLANDAVVKGGALKVEVKSGVVTLSGPVETDKQKQRAEKLTKKVKGVKQVVNNITFRK